MNSTEAQAVIEQGGLVTSGGYYFAKGYYFAYGTYPDCLRNAAIDATSKNFANRNWTQLTERDIVCQIGYRASGWQHPILNDGTVNFDELQKFLGQHDICAMSPEQIAVLCRQFFEET